MPRQATKRLLSTFFFTSLLLGLAAAPEARQSGLTVEAYCQLTKSLMESSVQEWEERVEVATSHQGDRKELAAKLEAVTERRRPQRDEVYSQYGLNPGADLRYASEHRAEIEGYLEENPEVREALDSLKTRVNTLIQQFEAVAPAPPEGA
jgi:hypothetical protein